MFPSHSVYRACKCTVNNAPTVADAETHACCWASVRGPSLRALAGPMVLSLYFWSYFLCSFHLRPRGVLGGPCARAPSVS